LRFERIIGHSFVFKTAEVERYRDKDRKAGRPRKVQGEPLVAPMAREESEEEIFLPEAELTPATSIVRGLIFE
jgi:hypothetical protein